MLGFLLMIFILKCVLFFFFWIGFYFILFFLFWGGLLLRIIVTLYCLDCSANTELQLILLFFPDFASWRSKFILFSFFFSMLTSAEFSPQNTFFSPFFQLCLLHQRGIVSLWFAHAVFFPLLFSHFVYFSFPLFSEIDARFCSFGTFNSTFVAQHLLYLFFPQPSAPTVALRLSTLFWSFSFCSVFLQPVFFFRQATFSLSFDSLQWLFPSLLDRCSL